MSYVVVTLTYGNDQRADMALPLEVAGRVAAEAVARVLKVYAPGSQSHQLAVQTPEGIRRLPANASLGEAGVLHGMLLELLEEEAPADLTQTRAILLTGSGESFPLEGRTEIGRRDAEHEIFPDIDLKPLDFRKIASRRHARIQQQENHFVVMDLGSKLGTWVNADKLEPNQPHVLADGDEIVFGPNGVRMTFRLGRTK